MSIADRTPQGAKRMAAGALTGTGLALASRVVRLKNKNTRKDALKGLGKDLKVGAVSGASLGSLYHKLSKRRENNQVASLQTDGSNIVEMSMLAGFSKKVSDSKVRSEKLSKDLKMLSGWYEKLAVMSSRASSFIDKHPHVTSALRWGASKFTKAVK